MKATHSACLQPNSKPCIVQTTNPNTKGRVNSKKKAAPDCTQATAMTKHLSLPLPAASLQPQTDVFASYSGCSYCRPTHSLGGPRPPLAPSPPRPACKSVNQKDFPRPRQQESTTKYTNFILPQQYSETNEGYSTQEISLSYKERGETNEGHST